MNYEVGKWYKFTGNGFLYEHPHECYYSKSSYISGERIYYSQFIFRGFYNENLDWFGEFVNPVLLKDLTEIQPFLPERHEDKYRNYTDDYNYLISLLKKLK